MKRFTQWIPLTAACAVIACAGIGASQTAERLKPRPEAREHGVRLSQAMKYNIFIQDDQAAGQVVDFIVSDGGCIDYIVASYDEQYYLIPYAAASFRYDDSVVFVDLAPARFEQVQFFAQNDWPDYYVPAYRQKVFTTFGVDARRGRATFRQNLDEDARDRREQREENRDLRREQREERRDARDRNRDAKDRDLDDDRDAARPPVPDRPTKPAPPKPDLKTPKPNPPATPAPPATPKKPAPKQPN